MVPYYSFPFVYDYRKGTNLAPVQMPAPMPTPMPMPVQEELPEEMPEENIQPLPQPVQEPIQQQAPLPMPMPQLMPQPVPKPMPQPCPQMMPIYQPMMPCPPMHQMYPCPQMMPIQQTMPASQYPDMMMPNAMPNAMPNMMPNIMMPNMPEIGGMEQSDMAYAAPYDYSDGRRPVLSNNPPRTSITLFKELTGYPNYGNPSGNADILYTGDRGEWTFNLPTLFSVGANQRAELVIRVVLDDDYNVDVSRYSANISINGNRVHTGRVPAEHGRPFGQRFNNWRELTFTVRNLRRNNRVNIENTSRTGPSNWIAFDWMELRIFPR